MTARPVPRLLLLLAFVWPILVWGIPAAAQGAAPLRIEQDKGQMVRLPQAAASVFIANPDIADLQVMSPTMVYLFGRRPGETSLIAVNGAEQVLVNRKIVVTRNLSALDRALRERLPSQRIQTGSVDGAIVLTGEVANPSQAEEARRLASQFAGGGDVINRLSITGSTQVMLRVRVSEVTREVREVLGFNWEGLVRIGGGYAIGIATGAAPLLVPASDALSQVLPNRSGSTTMSGFFGHQGDRWDVNGLIDALARDGLVTVLAEPNLVAASGETASFLAGGEFPIVVPQDRERTTVEFKPFGVSLAFTPVVLGQDRISMRVRPEVSELSERGAIVLNNFRIPALTTRRAETTVELASGQSFAIAGLLQNNMDEGIDKFPLLGDVPILGTLFRSSRFQRRESELVIIVTPYLVRPAPSPAQIAAPTDAIKPAGFLDRVLFGRLTQPGSGTVAPARMSLQGPVGFMVE